MFSRPLASWINGAKEESAMASQPQADGWLAENGAKELELLFRVIVFHPSVPILLADNDRHNLEASVGASKLLGLPQPVAAVNEPGVIDRLRISFVVANDVLEARSIHRKIDTISTERY